MIIQNGTIELLAKGEGSFDPETGHPITASERWSQPIPCQYIPTLVNRLARDSEGGHYTQSSYEILTESEATPCMGRLRLRDNDGRLIGTFSIMSAKRIEAVCQVQYLV